MYIYSIFHSQIFILQGRRKQLHPNGLNQRTIRPRPNHRSSRALPRPEAHEAASVPPSVGRHHLHEPVKLSLGSDI